MARKLKSTDAPRHRRGKVPRNHRELAEAIFAECDPVAIGRELLESGSERGSMVRMRMWETLVNFAFGKPEAATNAGASSGGVRLVWDMQTTQEELTERQ